jgi:hypothetical protein
MKLKNLLLTTALITLPLSSSFAKQDLFESGVNVSFGGEIRTQVGIRQQSEKYLKPLTPNNDNIAFNSNTAVHATIKGRCIKGWKYGAQLGIRTTTVDTAPSGKDYLDRTYIYVENKDYGRLEVGSNKGASNTMKIAGNSVAVGSGGTDGAWGGYLSLDRFTNAAAAVNENDTAADNDTGALREDSFIDSAKLPISEGVDSTGSHERYRKITYYSPEYNGFKLGITYSPDSKNTGAAAMPPYSGDINEKYSNVVTAGITWEKQFNSDKLKLSVVGQRADKKQASNVTSGIRSYHPIQAIMVGALYKHDNISVAASCGSHFKSTFEKVANVSNSFFYDAGIAYNLGKSNVSLTYLYSEKNTNPLHVVAVGADYALAPGIVPYAEVSYFTAHQKRKYNENKTGPQTSATIDTTTSIKKNDGTLFLLGTTFTF